MKEPSAATGSSILSDIYLQDAGFGKLDKAACSLLIHISNKQLAYAIYNPELNQFAALSSRSFGNTIYPDNLEKALEYIAGKDTFKERFKDVKIAVESNVFTLIPKELYDKSENRAYVDFATNDALSEGEVLADDLGSTEAYNVYQLPTYFVKGLKDIFPAAKIMHHTTPLIEGLTFEKRRSREDSLHISFSQKDITVLGLQIGRLVYQNRFEISHANDLIYYLLAICGQLQFDPKKVVIELMDELDKNGPYYGPLQDHFNNIRLSDRPSSFDYSDRFDQVPFFRFYTLFSIQKCA